MRLWGLTGGIASGKSTVRQMFAALGAETLDADALYHELITPQAPRFAAAPRSLCPVGADRSGHGASKYAAPRPSPLAQAIGAAFPGVLRADGTLDRLMLGHLVFDDARVRQRLEVIAHPAVAQAAAERLQALEQAGCPHAIYDVPLLYERQMAARFAGVVVVWAPEALQLARLMARNHLDVAAAQARFRAQWPLDRKRAQARWAIDNDGRRDDLEAQVRAVWAEMLASA